MDGTLPGAASCVYQSASAVSRLRSSPVVFAELIPSFRSCLHSGVLAPEGYAKRHSTPNLRQGHLATRVSHLSSPELRQPQGGRSQGASTDHRQPHNTSRQGKSLFFTSLKRASSSISNRIQVAKANARKGMIKWEVSLRGPWPEEHYNSLQSLQMEILDLLGQLLGVLAVLDHKWTKALLHRSQFSNPDFLGDMLTTFQLISTSLENGTSLPMIYNPLLGELPLFADPLDRRSALPSADRFLVPQNDSSRTPKRSKRTDLTPLTSSSARPR